MGKTKDKYYKYRSIENFKRFLDIVINNRLYGCSFRDLNDPMEGRFTYSDELSKESKDIIRKNISNRIICSASKQYDIGLMWSHYADSHRGCCIEFELGKTDLWERLYVKYQDELPKCNGEKDLENVLQTKSKHWEYEKEVRFIKTMKERSSYYMPIKITAIYLGIQMSNKDKRLINNIVDIINKKHKKDDDKIKVIEIKKENIDFGYN